MTLYTAGMRIRIHDFAINLRTCRKAKNRTIISVHPEYLDRDQLHPTNTVHYNHITMINN